MCWRTQHYKRLESSSLLTKNSSAIVLSALHRRQHSEDNDFSTFWFSIRSLHRPLNEVTALHLGVFSKNRRGVLVGAFWAPWHGSVYHTVNVIKSVSCQYLLARRAAPLCFSNSPPSVWLDSCSQAAPEMTWAPSGQLWGPPNMVSGLFQDSTGEPGGEGFSSGGVIRIETGLTLRWCVVFFSL